MDNSNKIILDLCGGTGSWSKPYKEAGYDVRVVTLPENDILTWDGYKDLPMVHGILCAPPCTQFSWARTNAKTPRDMKSAMDMVNACLNVVHHFQYKTISEHQKLPPLKFWALENPYGNLLWFLGRPAMIFHPYEFGDGYSKKTCLWGYFNEPKKTPAPRIVDGKFDRLLMPELQKIRSIGDIIWKDSKNRQELRSITPPKFAQAFFKANQ